MGRKFTTAVSSNTKTDVTADALIAIVDDVGGTPDLAGISPTDLLGELTWFNEAVDDRVDALLADGTGIDTVYDDAGNLLTVTVDLGDFDTDDLGEGLTNLYYTDERVDDRASSLIQDGTGITWAYDDGAGTLTPTVSLSVFDTGDLSEGSNLYYTEGRVSANASVAANTTHRTSTGADHSYIDQSVISGASPTFTATNITGVPAASVLAGALGAGAYSFTINAIGAAITDGTEDVSFLNTTAASVGAQQYSPAFRQQGAGWKTDAVAASQSVEFRSYVVPVQGAAAPSGNWTLESSINGGAYASPLTYSSAGLLTVTTLAGTISTATQNSVTTMTGLVSVGALNSGSITSGFGNIDIGVSAFTTTGNGSTFGQIGLTANPTGAFAIKVTGRSATNDSLIQFYRSDGVTSEGFLNAQANGLDWYGPSATRVLSMTDAGIAITGTLSAGATTINGDITSSAVDPKFSLLSTSTPYNFFFQIVGSGDNRLRLYDQTAGAERLSVSTAGAFDFQSGSITTTGTAATGALTVTGSANAAVAHVSANTAIFKATTSAGITVLSGDAGAAALGFGTPSSAVGGNYILFDYNAGAEFLTVVVDGTTQATFSGTSPLATFAGAVNVTGDLKVGPDAAAGVMANFREDFAGNVAIYIENQQGAVGSDIELQLRTPGANHSIKSVRSTGVLTFTGGAGYSFDGAATFAGAGTFGGSLTATGTIRKEGVSGRYIDLVADSSGGYLDSGHFIQFRVNGTDSAMRIAADKTVMIGTTTDTYGTFQVLGDVMFGSVLGDSFYTSANSINSGYDTAANHVFIINHRGYQNGTTQFRDVQIRNGKGGTVVTIDGSAGALVMATASSLVMATGALATTATDGFLYAPTCAGVPTGIPTTYTGTVALVFDTTNNNLYVYDGSWIKVALA